ncbi:hypothetical protein OAO87_00520 [bacterium]|nr:hypothetical protein [bacterium]
MPDPACGVGGVLANASGSTKAMLLPPPPAVTSTGIVIAIVCFSALPPKS